MLSSLRKTLVAIGVITFCQVVLADDYSDVGTLLRSGKANEAVARADQFLSSKPKDAQMRFFRGVALAELGRSNEAISTFTRLTEDFPELPEPYNNLAVIYASQNQFDKARAALEMAIRTNPSYSTAHENLGDIYARLASQAYSKALQLDASNTGIQPKLSLIRDIFSIGGRKTTTAAAAPAPAPRPVAAPTPAPAPMAAAPTPAPAPAAQAAAKPAAPGTDKDIETALQTWANAWSSRDMKAYLAAYAPEFNGGKGSRKEWEAEREARITSKSRISVKISNLSVSMKGTRATATFKQDYSADKLSVSSRKMVEFSQLGGRWLIVSESSK